MKEFILKELKKNVKEHEVFLQNTEINEIHLQRNEINFIDKTINNGYGIRVHDKGIGFSASNIFTESEIRQTIQNALKSSRMTKKVDFYFPSKKPFKRVKSTDKKIKDGEEVVKDYVKELLKSIPSEVMISFGKIRTYDSHIEIINSEGLDLTREETNFMVELSLIIEKNGKKVEFWPHFYSRRIKDLPVSNIHKWVKIAKDQLIAIEPKTEKTTVIFSPTSVLDGLGSTVGYHATSFTKINKMSKLSLGEEVAKKDLTIISDGLYPYGMMTSGFDDEGIPQKKNILIRNGVFKNFVYSQFYAIKDKTKSTGNGFRQGPTFFVFDGKYMNQPTDQVSNFYIKPGRKTLDELIREVDHGILVDTFSWLSPDYVTGKFSSEIRTGYYIDKGEISKPIKGGLVTGNFFDLIKNISGISNKSVITSGGTVLAGVCPYIRFEDVQIAGK